MPELPEVETIRRTLEPLLTGKRIQSFELLWARTLAFPALTDARHSMIGTTIAGVRRRGKLVVLELDSGDLITIHLRMTGELLYRDAGILPRATEREPYLRAIFGLSPCAELLFYDTRKFGRISLYTRETSASLDTTLGIEPLDAGFTTAALAIILRRERRLKSLLLDQHLIAGLGNIYVDEALFAARLHPLRPANTLGESEVAELRTAIVDVLSTAIAGHGTTLRDYRSGLGEPGTNQHRLHVYGKPAGSPCSRCGAPLARISVDQRSTTFCPECQPTIAHMLNR
ncbi:MAG: bifunctional DNA-formamidopyrimidine glycosylase/DNA-(apurinic or apyrimidinic site) lyase [Thermomicrobiales bacterium]